MTKIKPIKLQLVEVNCSVCGSKEKSSKPVFEGYDIEFKTCTNKFTFFKCLSCGHIYLSPMPKIKDVSKIYSNYLTTNTESPYKASGLSEASKTILLINIA
jgi:uncharacterized Zn finger protein